MFKSSTREEVALNAGYNLGNSLAQQQKFREAITAYEDVLKKWPECTKAKENLELIKSMMKEEESSDSDSGDGKKEESDSKDSKNEQRDSEEGQEQKEQEPSDLQENKEEQSEKSQEQQKDAAKPSDEKQDEQEQKQTASQEEQDADLWLNQISNDPKTFLKNKFYIESKKNATTRGVDPW